MLTASDTGQDMTPRTLRDEGIVIAGRLIGADGNRLFFADDLAATLVAGDAFVAFVKARIDAYIEANALEAPAEPGEAAIPDGLVAPRELVKASANPGSRVHFGQRVRNSGLSAPQPCSNVIEAGDCV